MKSKILFVATFNLLAMAIAPAGESTRTEKSVVEESAELGASVAVGYSSIYLFRGLNAGENQITTQIDYDIPGLPVSVGVWYGNPTSASAVNPSHGDELNLYSKVKHRFGAVEGWLSYMAYVYPETGADNTNEVGTGLSTALGPLDFALGVYYDFDIEGWYLEPTVGHSFSLCDFASLDLTAGISYQIDYNAGGSDWNNVLLKASVPFVLNDHATLTPYVSSSFALEAIDGFQDDEIFGGVTLTVTF